MADDKPIDPFIPNDGDYGDSLPGIYTNRFYIRSGPIISRLMVGEVVTHQTRWTAALVVPSENLLQLADLIYQLFGRTPPSPPVASEGEKNG